MSVETPVAPHPPADRDRPATRRLSHSRPLRGLRADPMVAFSVAGLTGGLIARYGFGADRLSDGLWLSALVVVGLPLAVRTGMELVRGRLHADVIAALAILTSLLMGEYLAGAIIVVMQASGEGLERRAFRRASSALDQLIASAPRLAHRMEGGQLVEIAAESVRAGDRLVIKPDELAPVDALVVTGASSVDQSALTGEAAAVDLMPGSTIMSGTLNLQGALEVEAMRPAAESQYEQIVTLVREAQAGRPPIVRIADRAAMVFTPLTLVMCALAWMVTGDPGTMLSVLVVATPCPLILAVPVAVFAGINAAANRGIIVKHGSAIEQAGTARAVVFDKTGTLTSGSPEVTGIIAADGYDAAMVLHAAASLEQYSTHPLGRALAAYGAERVGPPVTAAAITETVGYGICGLVEGRTVAVGSLRLASPEARAAAQALLSPADEADTTRALVLIDGTPAGVVTFADRPRPGVRAMVDDLATLGVERVVMLTGDNLGTARAAGDEIGISEVHAGLLPSQKVDVVRALKATVGPTVMVGDGTNDAPALATATAGIAMGARGSGISAEAADIVLLRDDVTDVVATIRIGKRMRRIALQSVFAGIGLSVGLMVLAVFGLIAPVSGALWQEVIDVAVVLNALRVRSV